MPVLTIPQALDYARSGGFAGDPLITMVAIWMAESGLNTDATNTAGNTPPSTDRGIAEINSYWHPEVSDACAFDPACAAGACWTISQHGTDFTPWTTYAGGQYLLYLPQVKAALVSTTPGPNPDPVKQLLLDIAKLINERIS